MVHEKNFGRSLCRRTTKVFFNERPCQVNSSCDAGGSPNSAGAYKNAITLDPDGRVLTLQLLRATPVK
jgi:hypothetical protein